jgi:hypothetical protein
VGLKGGIREVSLATLTRLLCERAVISIGLATCAVRQPSVGEACIALIRIQL